MKRGACVALILFGLVILFSFQSLFCRLYTSSHGGAGAIPFAVGYAGIVGVCTLAAGGFAYSPARATILLGLLNAAMILLFNLSMVRAGNLGSYAFMMVCMLSGGILVPMVYDVFYVGERLSPLGYAGVAGMLIAFVIMNLDGFKGEKSGKYLLWCALLFVVNGCYGILMHLQQLLMKGAERSEMIVTTFLGMAVLTTVFELLFNRKKYIEEFRMSRKSLLYLLISSVCATLAVNVLLFLMRKINLTVLNVVNNGGVLALSAIYAFVIFKEKPAPRIVVGIAIACASIVLLSL